VLTLYSSQVQDMTALLSPFLSTSSTLSASILLSQVQSSLSKAHLFRAKSQIEIQRKAECWKALC